MAHGYRIEATYEDGYVHRETPEDHSPYQPGANYYNDILNGRPTEAGHGRMTEFALHPDPENGRKRWSLDWTQLWGMTNPEPIYNRDMTLTIAIDGSGDGTPETLLHRLGYRYEDEDGQTVEQVIEIVDDTAINLPELTSG